MFEHLKYMTQKCQLKIESKTPDVLDESTYGVDSKVSCTEVGSTNGTTFTVLACLYLGVSL